MLPGTSQSIAGLSFSKPVLAVLRSGFKVRWSKNSQDDILKYILKQVEETEPQEKDSLAHLTWEWAREQVRFELEPQSSIRRLGELSASPLREAILEDLKERLTSALHDTGSISGLEASYRQAFEQYRQGDHNLFQRIIKGGLSELRESALERLKRVPEHTAETVNFDGRAPFFEVHIPGHVYKARAKYRVPAEYPPLARRALISGSVTVEIVIDGQGDVVHAEAVDGPALLRGASETAARMWKYYPVEAGDQRVRYMRVIVFDFSL
jgi:hypothetical protein